MRVSIVLSLFVFNILACNQSESNQNPHQNPTHNFAVHRLIILNDNNEMLMCREQHVWATPSFVYKDRQYVKEGLDSLATAYGITIKNAELRGQFSYKYDYHPHATLRHYYVARYVNGEVKVPEKMEEAKWVSIPEAIELNTVTAIKEITQQIIAFPEAVWGASFLVSHVGDEHPTSRVEAFYPLFQ